MTRIDALCWTFWFINGALAYFNIRHEERKADGKWTQFDRLFWIFACLFGGTILLLVFLVIDLAMAIANTKWAKREAKW